MAKANSIGATGRSVLWFLVGTLGLIEAVAAIAAGFSDVGAEAVLFYSVIALGLVLAALVGMYLKDPAFLMAEAAHLVPLTVVRELGDRFDPALLRVLLRTLSPEAFRGTGPDVEEEQPDETESDDLVEVEEEEEDVDWAEEMSELNEHLDELLEKNPERDT